MIQPSFFDLQDRLHTIDKNGDPLARINETVNWEMFRPALEKSRDKKRQSTVGPKGYLELGRLYNLSALQPPQLQVRVCRMNKKKYKDTVMVADALIFQKS